jgi:hypothetical protein
MWRVLIHYAANSNTGTGTMEKVYFNYLQQKPNMLQESRILAPTENN